MRVFNTLTRSKEELVPLEPGHVKIYCCGPTVYNRIHVGNARPFILFDVLRRYLRYRGFKVTYVQNFTDIDDKVIRRANEDGVAFDVIAERYIREYQTDAAGLGIEPADVHPKATDNIDAIIALVASLVDEGYAYLLDDGVYYRVGKFEPYGKLSHQPIDDLMAGARIEVGESKESPLDFCLWKLAKPGEPSWESPWGAGRPGWHIECSAMAARHLGKTVDVHCGGQDLVFPHHENEIAQSEAAHGCDFARYWMHNGFLSIDNQKMSKSKGNFFTVRDAAEAYGYPSIRMFMLSAHYRSPLNYSEESLQQARATLERLNTSVRNLRFLMENGERDSIEADAAIAKWPGYIDRFHNAMDDDLNTADALGVLFELVREVNTAVTAFPNASLAETCLGYITEITDVLGLSGNSKAEVLDSEIEALIEVRRQARASRNFKEADRIRDELAAQGIILEDTPQGVKWRKA